MTTTRLVVGPLTICALTSVVLTAQVGQERYVAPLQNWAAPLYWQPTVAESHAANPETAAKSRDNAAAAVPIGSNALVFVAMTPCRVVDTRVGPGFPAPFGAPSLVGGTARTFPIQTSTNCPIYSLAQAYSFNVTVVPPAPLNFLTMWPTGQPRPTVSTLNAPQGQVVANAAIVPAGTPNGSIDVYASNNTDLIIDINGYYAAPTDVDSNTGLGRGALSSNTTGHANTASGIFALYRNTTGSWNTASGHSALQDNTTGNYNTASGDGALNSNTTGSANTASGAEALVNNTTGDENTAVGYSTLAGNTAGSGNTASGTSALFHTTGSYNTASGASALFNNTTGNYNTALGQSAGYNLTTGNNNVAIANVGMAAECCAIRIGTVGTQFSAYIAGIAGVNVSNSAPVLIDTTSGQLGTIFSSRRYKEDIADMSEASADLMRLHPVTFRYKKPYADGSKPIDYGLIAEEVAEIYPDLVVRGADGKIETVQYQKLTPMLLNELQREHQRGEQQGDTIRQQSERLRALRGSALRA
jgi:hypothetical protein